MNAKENAMINECLWDPYDETRELAKAISAKDN